MNESTVRELLLRSAGGRKDYCRYGAGTGTGSDNKYTIFIDFLLLS